MESTKYQASVTQLTCSGCNQKFWVGISIPCSCEAPYELVIHTLDVMPSALYFWGCYKMGHLVEIIEDD